MSELGDIPTAKYSCVSSISAGEPLIGSGTQASHWLLLEFDTPWQERAIENADLEDPIKSRLLEFESQTAGGRVQFIRGANGVSDKPRLFAARSDKPDRPLRLTRLSGYQDILELDFDALFNEPVPEAEQHDPILIVCTNGLRDLCCARNGTPAFQALSALDPEHVYQTTHLGGHRFAANAIWLPFGVNYGRLDPDNAGELLEKMNKKQISLPNFRGRTTMPSPAQAAEYCLREESNLLNLNDLELASVEGEEPSWQVTFKIRPTGERALVEVEKEPDLYEIFATTGDDEPKMTGEFNCRVVEG